MKSKISLALLGLAFMAQMSHAQTAAPAPAATTAQAAATRAAPVATILYSAKLVRNGVAEKQMRLSTPVGHPTSFSSVTTTPSHCVFKDLFGGKSELKLEARDGVSLVLVPTTLANKEVVSLVSVSVSTFTPSGNVQSGSCAVPTGKGSEQSFTDVVKLGETGVKAYKLDNGLQVEIRVDRIQLPTPPVGAVAQ